MSKKPPLFSIIICLYRVTDQFFIDLKKYKKLKYPHYEIVIVTEKESDISDKKLPWKIVKAKKNGISLGEKRDLGIQASKGSFCAFIDDDAYPDPQWLTNAFNIFREHPPIAAVGGPNVTPEEDSYWAKIGGFIYSSYLTSGEAQFRFIPKKRRFIGELQGVNLIIRKNVLKKLGGFRSKLSSGDDSKVCSDILKLGYQVLYDPEVKVFHHRRAFPVAHLKQIRNMGTHRGFFVKAFPDTLSPMYFLPSFLTVGLLIGIVSACILPVIRIPFLFVFLCFFLLAFLSEVRKIGVISAIVVAVGIMITHIVYGISFLKGLTLKSIEKK